MASKEYQNYLAAQVISEGAIVSYRTLSRALKVHVNTAKQMLYEFHRIQTGKKPGSVHATYLVCGVCPRQVNQTNGTPSQSDVKDTVMDDGFASSSIPQPDEEQEPESEEVPEILITVIPEEKLEECKSQFSHIDCVHVYSIEPAPLDNIQLLSDCTRALKQKTAGEDPLETWKIYGTIHNPNGKRRKVGARPPQPEPAPKPQPAVTAPKAAPKPAPAAAQQKTDSRPSTSGTESTKSTKNEQKPQAAKPPNLKRDSSSLLKSFAKTKPPEKKEASKAGAAKEDDEEMPDFSEGEDSEMAALPEVDEKSKEKAEAERKAKAERERTLKKMMEDDDEEEKKSVEEEDAEMQDPEEEAKVQEQEDSSKEAAEAQVTATGGRRRGRRRVMKKKHFKDAEGYMVTKEEAVWESFSEDEEPPKPALKKPAVAPSSAKSTKETGKKSSGKPGQGNLMSFFSKK